MKHRLVDSQGLITPETLQQLSQLSGLTTCQCPDHLTQILASIREFREYQKRCIAEKPNDVFIHEWLAATTLTIEHLISNTILQLARLEGYVDDQNGTIRAKPKT